MNKKILRISYPQRNITFSAEYLLKHRHLIAFWVGLLDGDGGMYVRPDDESSRLRYTISISLENKAENVRMLEQLVAFIGGHAREEVKYKRVYWEEGGTSQVLESLKIFETYPPLTSRLQLRLLFIRECFSQGQNGLTWFHENKSFIFGGRETLLDQIEENRVQVNTLDYFPYWVSGFIEAEGCFPRKKNKYLEFSIGQKGDKFLIEGIKTYFQGTTKVSHYKKKNFFYWRASNQKVMNTIIAHCHENPLTGLLGYKKKTLAEALLWCNWKPRT